MISLFFDSQITYDEDGSPIYDRPNTAAQLRKMFSSFLSNGVLGSTNNYQVVAKSGMSVTVQPGMCWIEGACGFETDARTLQLAPSGTQDRIDRIVLRSDLSVDVRSINLYVVKGTEAAAPVAPALTRNSTIYEIAIADILVSKNSTAITQQRITDTRTNTNLCGIVTGIIKQVDTTTLYNQIQSDLANFRTNEQASFKIWFDSVKDILDENIAAHLLSLMDTKIDKTTLNQANGVAGLNANSKLVQMPTAADVGAVPTSRTVNNKALSSNISLSAMDVGAVPTSRTINNKPLSSNVTLTTNDIGINALFLAVHPVGDIYMTTVSTNPGSRFGGTWVAWGSGRVPVGVNTGDSSFSSVERTGGAKTHTLTVREMPSHQHNIFDIAVQKREATGWNFIDEAVGRWENVLKTTESAGGGSSHNNLQPYITCYMWKRTA